MRSPSSRSSPSFYSKDDKFFKKPHRPFLPPSSSPSPSPSPSLYLIIIGILFLISVSALVFAISASRRPPRIFTVYRCGRNEDTLRTFRSKSDGGDDGAVPRPKLLGLVGIQTGFGAADRREAVRSTWFPSGPDGLVNLERATGLALRFVIGGTKDTRKMADLRKEGEKYHDFMLIDVDEEYVKPPHKTLAFLKAAFNLFDAEFYVKMDDNIYLRPDRLATLLAKDRAHRLTYIGCMKKGPVITDPKMKWYESLGHLIGSEYFSHAYGPIYALSAEVVESLATAKNNSLRMFSNEDVTVGSWMLSMNVIHEDNRAMCHAKCTPSSVAIWDMPRCSGLCDPANGMKKLHNITMCSKSPTLTPEELE